MQWCECFEKPANWHICLRFAIEFARSEPLIILEHSSHLVICNNLLKHFTVDIVALQALARLSATKDVAISSEPGINKGYTRCVLKVSKGEAWLDALRVVNVRMQEKVSKGLVKG